MKGIGNWRPHDYPGVWRYGPAWARPIVAAAPWITFALTLAAFYLAQGSLMLADGVDFALPETSLHARDVTGPVAVLMPGPAMRQNEEDEPSSKVMVFFDDARYVLPEGAAALAARFGSAFGARHNGTLVLLSDRRVSSGDLMQVISIARRAGVKDVRVAGRPN